MYNQNPYDIEYERKIRVETEKLRQLMVEIDTKNSAECTLNVAAQWNFEINVNEVSQVAAVSVRHLVTAVCADIDLNMLLTRAVPTQSSKSFDVDSKHLFQAACGGKTIVGLWEIFATTSER